MTRLKSLRALYDAVKAGTAMRTDVENAACSIWNDGSHIDVGDSYVGSIDAALALHNDVLPGWEWMLGNNGTVTVIPPERMFAETGLVGPTVRVENNSACAWLLAILSALIAQEEAQS